MITVGYVITVAIVTQWLRVRATVPEHRQRATLYAVVTSARLLLPDSGRRRSGSC